MLDTFWSAFAGRELDATPLPTTGKQRIVACVNVWNDLPALRQTLPTWYPYVERIIAVDGAYDETGHALSTDGTREFLRTMPNVTLIDAAGLTQCEKRTRYLAAGQDGDMLFVIDADEMVINAVQFQSMPACDVGWVRVTSKLYQRPYGQPRVFRWRPGLHYHGRHHWIYEDDRLVCTHQYGGAGYNHRLVNVGLDNQRRLGRSPERMAVKHSHQQVQIRLEKELSAAPHTVMSDSKDRARECLHILSYAYRDDGLAPSRLHTAINRTTPHSSVFFKTRPGPFNVPDQYSAAHHTLKLSTAIASADVLHYHGVMSAAQNSMHKRTPCVFHHHGTLFRNNADQYMKEATARNALVLLSNLELFSWVGNGTAYFLPNTVPVARYAELRQKMQRPFDGSSPFRIAHSPSQPQRKGTEAFLKICAHLKSTGIPIEPVILTGMDHADVLHQKAACHAAFDSFWLGMQCSGIEAAAMGLAVIAGDPTVATRYRSTFGEIPFTYANEPDELEYVLKRLVTDPSWRDEEARRVNQFVIDHHDESAVALRYLDLLDYKFGWRTSHNVRPADSHRFQAVR
jgi:hypothetical protein